MGEVTAMHRLTSGTSRLSGLGVPAIDTTWALSALILLTIICVGTLALMRRPGPRLHVRDSRDPGRSVLAAVARPSSAIPLATLARELAARSGRIALMTVVVPATDATGRDTARALLESARVAAGEDGHETCGIVRAARSTADGVLHVSVERDVTLVVVGWPSGARWTRRFPGPVARIVADVPAPVVVARLDGHEWSEVAVQPLGDAANDRWTSSMSLAVTLAQRLGAKRGIPVLMDTDPPQHAGTPPSVPERSGAVRGPVGQPQRLTVVAVAPDAGDLTDALARTPPEGDVLLVLAHGTGAERHRPPLSASTGLDHTDGDATRPEHA